MLNSEQINDFLSNFNYPVRRQLNHYLYRLLLLFLEQQHHLVEWEVSPIQIMTWYVTDYQKSEVK